VAAPRHALVKTRESEMSSTQVLHRPGRCFAYPAAAMQLLPAVVRLASGGLSRLERWLTLLLHVRKNGHQSVDELPRHTLVKDLLEPDRRP